MAAEHRRVVAQSNDHATALADNLVKQGFVMESQTANEWFMRKARKRLGDITASIYIGARSSMPATPPGGLVPPPAPPRPSGPPNWGPPA